MTFSCKRKNEAEKILTNVKKLLIIIEAEFFELVK